MFYVLNFANHQFVSCNTIAQVVVTIAGILGTGLDKDDIEIINGFSDDSRLSVDEFFTKYAEEDAK